ncbi:hypothetical protein LWI28_021092 [Acer negundo]|uniref:Retrovirus-related Pol polyprotein from transposon TNT 1-94-like beta-barrel domain-containing protein n=1 Tax=Acer negundo TaxID=4023 RepID=A0AAD5J7H9_ACENE|nr:hypothetical protein LWI28_021092 [Acer negundo]
MDAEKNMASFLNPNVQLDRFDGTNFTHWKGKLFFLLTVLKIAYVLDPNLQPLPEPDKNKDTDTLEAESKKRSKDEVMCQGHILNTLSDSLCDLYNTMKSPKEIWNALEYKYKAEKEELNMAAATKSFDWWLDSGATIHVCNDKSLFFAYEEENVGEVVLMGNHVLPRFLEKGVSIFNLPLERNYF